MVTYAKTRTIHAPIEKVFDAVAHIENFSVAVPHITNIEFLTDQRKGVGTRFSETRVMNGREETTELEVKEYVENERVRMVSDAGGIIWDTVFTVETVGDHTVLRMVMEARAYKLFSKLMNRLIKGMVGKAIEGDMDAVKAYCEGTN